MSVTIEDVEHVASLARLNLTEEEKHLYARQLSQILEHAGKVSELDTSTAEATAHPLAARDVVRPDEVRPCLSPEKALENSPESENGYFRVPKIV